MQLAPVDPAAMALRLVAEIVRDMPMDLAELASCSGTSHDVGTGSGAAERVAAAVATCRACPGLALCRAWAQSLPDQHRRGVVLAGQIHRPSGRAVMTEAQRLAARRASNRECARRRRAAA